jgi:hypothetical protein
MRKPGAVNFVFNSGKVCGALRAFLEQVNQAAFKSFHSFRAAVACIIYFVFVGHFASQKLPLRPQLCSYLRDMSAKPGSDLPETGSMLLTRGE